MECSIWCVADMDLVFSCHVLRIMKNKKNIAFGHLRPRAQCSFASSKIRGPCFARVRRPGVTAFGHNAHALSRAAKKAYIDETIFAIETRFGTDDFFQRLEPAPIVAGINAGMKYVVTKPYSEIHEDNSLAFFNKIILFSVYILRTMSEETKGDTEYESPEDFFCKGIDDAFNKSRLRTAIDHVNDTDFLDQLAIDDDLPILMNQLDPVCNPLEYFRHDGNLALERIYRGFSIKLLFENIYRLTADYNTRCLPSLERHFPGFYHSLIEKKSVFVRKALVPCEMKGCDEAELDQQLEELSWDQRSKDDFQRKYERLRTQMRKNRVMFEPVTSQLIGLLEREARYPPLINPFLTLLGEAYGTYGGQGNKTINDLFRCIKAKGMQEYEMPRVVSTFLPALLFPFITDKELVCYRVDNMDMSTDEFVSKGVLSTSLSLRVVTNHIHWVKDPSRKLKITVPPGTPFMPLIVTQTYQAEIALIPGTTLKKKTEKTTRDGNNVVEYIVTKPPPTLDNREVATILRTAIFYCEKNKEIPLHLESVPDTDEQKLFLYNLVNRKYGGDW